MIEIQSKHGIVNRAPAELYMLFVDMRNFVEYLPEDQKSKVTADYDSLKAEVQGFSMGVRCSAREPYSRVSYVDDGAPFQFNVDFFFEPVEGNDHKTEFHINFSAELNLMMKMLLNNMIKEGMDKIVDKLESL